MRSQCFTESTLGVSRSTSPTAGAARAGGRGVGVVSRPGLAGCFFGGLAAASVGSVEARMVRDSSRGGRLGRFAHKKSYVVQRRCNFAAEKSLTFTIRYLRLYGKGVGRLFAYEQSPQEESVPQWPADVTKGTTVRGEDYEFASDRPRFP